MTGNKKPFPTLPFLIVVVFLVFTSGMLETDQPSSVESPSLPQPPQLPQPTQLPPRSSEINEIESVFIETLNADDITPLTEIRRYDVPLFPQETDIRATPWPLYTFEPKRFSSTIGYTSAYAPIFNFQSEIWPTSKWLVNSYLNYPQITNQELDLDSNNEFVYEILPKDLADQEDFLFDINEYYINVDFRDLQNIRSLCKDIEEFKLDKNRSEDISEIVESVFEFLAKIKFKRSPDLNILSDILVDLFILKILPKNIVGEVRVFIRGSADRCSDNMENCEIDIQKQPYVYDFIDFHPTIDQGPSLNRELSGFRSDIQRKYIPTAPDNFTNKDLPELRSKFFSEDILTRLIQQCDPSSVNERIGILEGETKNKLNEFDRNIQIFLVFRRNWGDS